MDQQFPGYIFKYGDSNQYDQLVTGRPLPLWSTQLLACVEIVKLSTDSFEIRI